MTKRCPAFDFGLFLGARQAKQCVSKLNDVSSLVLPRSLGTRSIINTISISTEVHVCKDGQGSFSSAPFGHEGNYICLPIVNVQLIISRS